jgi:hypothetical protein
MRDETDAPVDKGCYPDCDSGTLATTVFHIHLYFIFCVRSVGILLCWNGKGDGCLDEIPAISFGIMGKTSVIITILTWCCTRIQDIHSACTSLQAESDQQDAPVNRNCLESVQRVCVYISSAEINLSRSFLLTESVVSALNENVRLWTLFMMCVRLCIYLQFVWYNYSVGRPAVTLVGDSCSHCWRMWSVSQGGQCGVFISAPPINCGQF